MRSSSCCFFLCGPSQPSVLPASVAIGVVAAACRFACRPATLCRAGAAEVAAVTATRERLVRPDLLAAPTPVTASALHVALVTGVLPTIRCSRPPGTIFVGTEFSVGRQLGGLGDRAHDL